MIFFKRMLCVFCLLLALTFKFGFSTEGVNIYTIKDEKILLLLSKEEYGWTDFTGNADFYSDFEYAANNVKIRLDEQALTEELERHCRGQYIKGLLEIPNFAKFLYRHSAAREAHEETMGVFYYPYEIDPRPDKNVENGISWFLQRFDTKYRINVTIPTSKNHRMHASWFVKANNFITENHFNAVLEELKKKAVVFDIPYDYISKQEYKWFDIDTLLIENGKLETLNLATPFYEMMITPEAQKMLKKIKQSA